jgi:peptide/nickel transport system permease protein
MPTILRNQRWWVARTAALPVHLLGFAIVVFFLVRLIPGDPIAQISGGQPMTPAQQAAARASLGLSGSLPTQLGHYLSNVVTLHFGNSIITGQPVLPNLIGKLPATVELAVIAMAGAILLTLLSALLIVLRPRNVISRALAGYARAAGAVPDFVLGVAGILLFYSTLRWLPAPLGLYDPILNAPPKITSFPILDALLSSNTRLFSSMVSHLVLFFGQPVSRRYLNEICDGVAPALRRRGLVRDRYDHKLFRDNLLAF